MKKRVRDQDSSEVLVESCDERNFLSVFSPLRDAFRVLVSTLNIKAFDEKKKVAKEWFLSWDVLEDAIPYLQREETIFVTGGYLHRPLHSMELINTLTHQVELSKDTLRTARCEHSSVIIDGVLYIMGGTTTSTSQPPSRDVEAYDTVYRRWLIPSVPNMNVARRGHCSVGLNGFVYSMGGESRNPFGYPVLLNHVERLNTKTLSWDVCTHLIYPRKNFSASVYMDKIYVVGGDQKSIERFDPAIGVWAEINKMAGPWPLYCGAALAPGIGPGTLLLCGGGKKGSGTKTLELETGLITPRRSHTLHEARRMCAVVTSGDSVYVLGGVGMGPNDHGQGDPLSGVESFDYAEGNWLRVPNLKEARYCCSAAF